MSALDEIEQHAKGLESAADGLDKSGIGQHPTRGHSAVLRRMASAMRVDAANGRVPHEFNDQSSWYGSAESLSVPASVSRTLKACGLPTDQKITLAEFDAKAGVTEVSVADRLTAKRYLTAIGRIAA